MKYLGFYNKIVNVRINTFSCIYVFIFGAFSIPTTKFFWCGVLGYQYSKSYLPEWVSGSSVGHRKWSPDKCSEYLSPCETWKVHISDEIIPKEDGELCSTCQRMFSDDRPAAGVQMLDPGRVSNSQPEVSCVQHISLATLKQEPENQHHMEHELCAEES